MLSAFSQSGSTVPTLRQGLQSLPSTNLLCSNHTEMRTHVESFVAYLGGYLLDQWDVIRHYGFPGFASRQLLVR